MNSFFPNKKTQQNKKSQTKNSDNLLSHISYFHNYDLKMKIKSSAIKDYMLRLSSNGDEMM